MTYNKLNNIIKSQTQPEYIEDCGQFFEDNGLSPDTFSDNEFIIFSEQCDHYPTAVKLLEDANVPHQIHLDEWDYEYIII